MDGAPPATADLTLAVTMGACRLLRDMGFSPFVEFKLGNGRRADIAGLNGRGKFVIVEVKASVGDLKSDAKWRDYLPYCDCFYFAVPDGFPLDLFAEQVFLPERAGLIVADRFAGAVRRLAREEKMNAARRRVETLSFARKAANRLFREADAQGSPMLFAGRR